MKEVNQLTVKAELPKSEKELLDMIKENEHSYHEALRGALKFLLASPRKIITLSGPSCSGKTTTADYLVRKLIQNGVKVKVLSIDDFFKDRKTEKLVLGEKEDLDSVRAIDLDYLAECVEKLTAGKTALLPTFDFNTGKRSSVSEYHPEDCDVYLFEGIQAVYPEVTALFASLGKNSIFINVDSDVEFGECKLTKYDVRLVRRLLRDSLFRSASCEYTLFQWDSVRQNEDVSIFPYAGECDFHINSLVLYEILLYANRLPQKLAEIREDSPHFEHAFEIRQKLLTVTPNFLCEDMIPEQSLLREFIGKKQ